MLTLKELTDRAYELGKQAAINGDSGAPALSEEFMRMMRESTGVDWIPPLRAFVRGYQAQTSSAAEGKEA